MKSKINVKQEQRIGKFVRDFSIVVQDERSVNYNILRNMLRELLNSQDQEEENTVCEGAVFTDMELIAIEIAVQRSLKFEKGFGTKNEMIPNGYEEILRKLSKLTTK